MHVDDHEDIYTSILIFYVSLDSFGMTDVCFGFKASITQFQDTF